MTLRAVPLLLVLVVTMLQVACGGRQCVIPETGVEALVLLDGTWTVTAYDGRMDGEIVFDGDELETRWQDVTLHGNWEHLSSYDNAHEIRLIISEAWEGELQQRYGTFDEVDVSLVFAGPNHLYALQSDGAWTEWRRVVPLDE